MPNPTRTPRDDGAVDHDVAVDQPVLRRDAERNRRRILDAARTLLAERGSAVSYDEIADAAEVGVGTVYRRFPTRPDLFTALFYDQVTLIGQHARQTAAAQDPWQALEVFLTEVIDLQAADRGLKDLMLAASDDTRELASHARQQIAPAISDLLDRAQQLGQVRPDLTVADIALIPLMVGAVTDRARDVAPGLHRRVLALLLDGMRPRTEEQVPLPGSGMTAEQMDRILG